jgi:hypothetical protein
MLDFLKRLKQWFIDMYNWMKVGDSEGVDEDEY